LELLHHLDQMARANVLQKEVTDHGENVRL